MEAAVSFGDVAGYLASALVFLTFYMKTMIPLRVVGIASNCAFIVYAYLYGLYPVLVLHVVLLPLNFFRLRQMVRLTRHVEEAAQGDLNMEWLKPFASVRRMNAGQTLFRKGDKADQLFVIISGRFRLIETGIDLTAPSVVGEFALVADHRSRTQTVECVETGILLQMEYTRVEQLFFQNPQFGFYLLRLVSRRLMQNVATLESKLALVNADNATGIR